MSLSIPSIIHHLENVYPVGAKANATPPAIVLGGNRHYPDISDKLKTNRQVFIFIYEVKEDIHKVAGENLESNIKESLGLDMNERISTWQIDSKGEVVELLKALSDYLGQPLEYEAVVSTVSSVSRVSTVFYLYIPVVETSYYV